MDEAQFPPLLAPAQVPPAGPGGPGWSLSIFSHSRAILQDVLDADLSNEAFPFSTHQLVQAAGHPVGTNYCYWMGLELGEPWTCLHTHGCADLGYEV